MSACIFCQVAYADLTKIKFAHGRNLQIRELV